VKCFSLEKLWLGSHIISPKTVINCPNAHVYSLKQDDLVVYSKTSIFGIKVKSLHVPFYSFGLSTFILSVQEPVHVFQLDVTVSKVYWVSILLIDQSHFN
jgi:hypothetical protein